MNQKNLLVLILLSTHAIFCNTSTQHALKKPTQKRQDVFVFEGGATLGWWKNPSYTILDVSSNKDTASGNRSRVVPGFYLLFARNLYPFKNPAFTGKIGFRCSYGRRKDGLRNDFYDDDLPNTTIELVHNIQTMRLAPFLGFQYDRSRFSVSVWAAPTIAFKTVDWFGIYEKSTNAYIGQRLEPYNRAPFGEFGINIKLPFKQYGHVSLGYSFLLGVVTFKKEIINEDPHEAATDDYQDQLLLTDLNSTQLPETPKVKYRAHTLQIGFEIPF